MGYRPGPIFSVILRALEDAQLEGQLKTKEEAREYVRHTFGKAGRRMANKQAI
jgi:hypothetical protein